MNGQKLYRSVATSAAAVGMVALVGCSFAGEDVEDAAVSQPSSGVEGPVQTSNLVLEDNVYEIGETTATAVEVDETVLRVPVAEAGELDLRGVGDIVYSNEGPKFRLEIESINRVGDDLVFEGREAALTDVIRQGRIRVSTKFANQDQGDVATRHQKLDFNDDDGAIEPVDFDIDLGGDARLSDSGDEMVEGSIAGDLGAIFEVEVDDDEIVEQRVETVGNIDIEGDWELTTGDGSTLVAPVYEEVIDFDLFGIDHTIEPYVSTGFSVDGSVDSGMIEASLSANAQGIRAGVMIDESGSSGTTTGGSGGSGGSGGGGGGGGDADQLEQELSLDSGGMDVEQTIEPGYDGFGVGFGGDGEGEVELDWQIEVGVEVIGQGLSTEELATARPVQTSLEAHGDLERPSCSHAGSISNVGFASMYNNQIARIDDYTDAQSASHLSGVVDGCEADGSAAECTTNSDCGGGERCLGGICQPDTDLTVTLDWQDEINLDLNVQNGTDIYNSDEPGGEYDDGQLFLSSCGGCGGEDEFQYYEVFGFESVDDAMSDTFQIWISNESGYHEQSGDDDEIDASYTLTITDRNEFQKVFNGTIDSEAGSTSVTYEYTLPGG